MASPSPNPIHQSVQLMSSPVKGESDGKSNDINRVSPTSIVDFNHSEFDQDPPNMHEDHGIRVSSSSSFDYVMELKQLQHPLTETMTLPDSVDLFLPESVSLVRTCTPRDTLIFSSPMEDYGNVAIESIVPEPHLSTETSECSIPTVNHIPDASPLRRFRSLPAKWKSKASKSSHINKDPILHDDFNQDAKDVKPMRTCTRSGSIGCKNEKVLLSVLKKQRSLPLLSRPPQSAPSTNVRFNELMEVRYFYRSDDEIAIMKQCAMERRLQQELRRRLRRRLRKGESLFWPTAKRATSLSSNHVMNSFLSFFDSKWSSVQPNTNSAGAGIYYDIPDGGISNCGVQFACYDGDDDRESNECHGRVVLDKATATAGTNEKSWLANFGFPSPTISGVNAEEQLESPKTPLARSTTETSPDFIRQIANRISSIKFDHLVDNSATTANDNSLVAATLDPLNGTAALSSKVDEEIFDESSEDTAPIWLVTALTCGSKMKLTD